MESLTENRPPKRGNSNHGRGEGLEDWKRHAKGVAGAENIWLAAIGPDTPSAGEVTDEAITQSQIAATVAALLGEDYVKAAPAAAASVRGIAPR